MRTKGRPIVIKRGYDVRAMIEGVREIVRKRKEGTQAPLPLEKQEAAR